MQLVPPSSGPLICQGISTSPAHSPGQPCTHHEIDGLGYCFAHMPDDLLDEAEQITGYKRCRKLFGEPGACHQFAVKGTIPPMCKNHGANEGSNVRKGAAANIVDGRVIDRMAEIMSDHGEALMKPDPIGDPLSELLALAAEIRTWKEIMRKVTAYLVSRNQVRYSHKSYGEQVRAEILLYERAMERLGSILIQIGKLGIERKLAQIQEAQVAKVDRALTAALTATGLGLVEQQEARAVLARELLRAG
jgi:hypothetical protein